MKKLLILLLLSFLGANAQITLEIQGDFAFTPRQKDTLSVRYFNGWSYPNRYDEFPVIEERAFELRQGILDGDWPPLKPGVVPIGVSYDNHTGEPNYGRNRVDVVSGGVAGQYPALGTYSYNNHYISHRHIMATHMATIFSNAWKMHQNGYSFPGVDANGNYTLRGETQRLDAWGKDFGLAAWGTHYRHSDRDDLDANNDGLADGSGFYEDGSPVPTGDNIDYDGDERFLMNPTTKYLNNNTSVRTGQPWWVCFAMQRASLLSLGSLKEILAGDPTYEAQKQKVFHFYKGWANFSYSNMDWTLRDSFGANWRSLTNLSGNANLSAYGFQQQFTHYINGIGQDRITSVQGDIPFNNRDQGHVEYVGLYGMMFNEPFYADWAEDFFKLSQILYVFPSGYHGEYTRGRVELAAFNQYPDIVASSKLGNAINYAIGYINGAQGITNPWKYRDYITSLGDTDVLASGGYANANQSTTGGQKSIKGIVDVMLNHYITPAGGGSYGVHQNYQNEAYEPFVHNGNNYARTQLFVMANMIYDEPKYGRHKDNVFSGSENYGRTISGQHNESSGGMASAMSLDFGYGTAFALQAATYGMDATIINEVALKQNGTIPTTRNKKKDEVVGQL